MCLSAAVPQLSEYLAAVPVQDIGHFGKCRNAVVSKQLDVIGVRGGMNSRRFGNDETASTGSSRFVVSDEVGVWQPIAQHARHVTGGDNSIAQQDTADLDRLEQVWEKGRHSAVARRLSVSL